MFQNSEFTFLDILNLIILFFQFKTQMKLDRQATNNDLLRELHKDTDAILAKLDSIGRKEQ